MRAGAGENEAEGKAKGRHGCLRRLDRVLGGEKGFVTDPTFVYAGCEFG